MLQIRVLRTELEVTFEHISEQSPFIREDEIFNVYETVTKKHLEDSLRAVNMSLVEFMRQNFYNEFNIVDDPVVRSYMRRARYLDQIGNCPAITGPTSSTGHATNGFSVPPPPVQTSNGFGFGQTRILNSTPTPPPVSQATLFSSPPGLSQRPPSSGNQETINRRLERVQNQLDDAGLKGLFCPDALRLHFGDLSELLSNEEIENQALPFEMSSILNLNGGSTHPGNLLNMDIHREGQGGPPEPAPNSMPLIQEIDTHPGVSEGIRRSFEDESQEFYVESPSESVSNDVRIYDGDFAVLTESFQKLECSSPTNKFPHWTRPGPISASITLSKQSDSHRVSPDTTNVASTEEYPPLGAHLDPPNPSKNVTPPPGFENLQQDSTSRLPTVTEEATNQATSKTKPRYRPVDVSFAPAYNQFPIEFPKLFYKVFQDSIINSSEVNAYRDKFQEYLEQNTRLYSKQSSEFEWLTGTHLSRNPGAEGYIPNDAYVIDALQQYSKMYPNGMKPEQLVEIEDTMCAVDQTTCLGRSTAIMSIPELIDRRVLIKKEDGRYYLNNEIKSYELWRLPTGLTSNLYRILNARQITLVQDVSNYTGILNQRNGDPVTVEYQDIVRQANMFPMIFKISAQAVEQHSMRTAKIQLHDKLPRWKILLDQPFEIEGPVPFHCDCGKCVDTPPVPPVNESNAI